MKNACYNKIMFKKAGGLICGAVALSVGAFTMMGASAIEYNTDFVVDIDPDTTLTVPSNPVVLSLAPTPGGSFDSASFDVYASTNSKHGYTLTMEVEKNYLEGSYADADTGITPKVHAIPFVDGGITENDFSGSSSSDIINHWGVSINNTTSYNPIKSSILKTTSSASANDKTTFNVAAKVNAGSATGLYSTTINFTLLPNIDNSPQGISGGSIDSPSGGEGVGAAPNSFERIMEVHYYDILQSIYVLDDSPQGYHEQKEGEDITGKKRYFAMQHMTPQVCARAKTESEMQMMDLRDGKVYWIAKLKDGKCWMTQNLDLNLSTEKTLTPRDTDIKANWKPTFSTVDYDGRTTFGTSASGFGGGETVNYPYSMDVGDWYWIGNWNRNGESTWYTSPGGSAEKFLYDSYSKVSPHWQRNIPFEGNKEHGHMGNYYNLTAALAVNSLNEYGMNTNVGDSSICPAHWTLPKATGEYNGGNDDFYNLIYHYGENKSISGRDGASDKILTSAPLWFVRGGYFMGTHVDSGNYAYYWGGVTGPMSNAYIRSLGFSSAGYMTNYGMSGRYAISIRCIAR